MSSPAPMSVEHRADDATYNDLLHTVCSDCDPDVALCGADVAGDCWTTVGLECVVCEELAHYPCPGGCGR